MPAYTQIPTSSIHGGGGDAQPPSSPGPPELEYPLAGQVHWHGQQQEFAGGGRQIDLQQQPEAEAGGARGRPQRAILHPGHAVPFVASGSAVPSAAAAAAPVGGNNLRTAPPASLLGGDQQQAADEDMKEEDEEEKVAEHGVRVPRTLRPFYLHQWLDVQDTQDTWLEAQVIAVDPPEASQAAEEELADQIANRRLQGRKGPRASPPPSSAAAAAAASAGANAAAAVSPAPPLSQHGPAAQRIRVHYKSFHSKYDEWLDASSDHTRDMVSRIALLHTHTRVPHPIRYPRPFSAVGDAVDCKDTINVWHRAHVIAFNEPRQQVLVHYDDFSAQFDEWIDIDSYRLQPTGTFKQNNVMQAQQPQQSRNAAAARQAQLAHSHSHAATASNVASASALTAACTPEQIAKFQASERNELRFRELLRSRLQSDIIDQKEDGNCLFRSVSHQVYGTASHHALVRAACMSYIEGERAFFEHFIAGETFEEYIARMRLAGQWGDNVELQAMSEIYERPIEIYAYSHTPLKTFMATSSSSAAAAAGGGDGVPPAAAAGASGPAASVGPPAGGGVRPPAPPIRLSYHFASHYNSIIYRSRARAQAQLCQFPPGQVEQAALERAAQLRHMQEQQRAAVQAASASSSSVIPAGPLSHARSHFRSSLRSSGSSDGDPSSSWLDAGAAASLSELDAVFAAEVATAQAASLREADDADMMAAALQQSEREELDKQIERAAMEQAKLQQQQQQRQRAEASSAAAAAGRAGSPSAASPSSGGESSVEAAVLARALAESRAAAPASSLLSEDEQLAQALRLSSEERGGASGGGGGFESDEAALQAALRLSRSDAPSSSSQQAAQQQQQLPAAVSACVDFGFPLERCVEAFDVCGGGDSAGGAPLSPGQQEQLVQRMMDYLCSS